MSSRKENKMKHLSNVLNGIASLFSGLAEPRSYILDDGGFKADAQRLREDVCTFSTDFREQSDIVYVKNTPRKRKNKGG